MKETPQMSTDLPTHMRAAQWTTVPLEASLKVTLEAPLPKAAYKLPRNSALVKVAYASLNPVDHKVGEFVLARTFALGKQPWTPACDFAGSIVSTNLEHFKPGDRVYGTLALPSFGALAEYAVVTGAKQLFKLPDSVTLKDASTFGVAAQTALACLQPYVREGSKVIINGASGGTGTFGIQLAKILGCSVTAICSGKNAELCLSLGADDVVDYRSVDVVEELSKGGQQYDLLVDNITMCGPLAAKSHLFMKETGLYNTVTFSPDLASIIGALKLFLQPTWLGGSQRKGRVILGDSNPSSAGQIARWNVEGKLKPVIEKVYSLDEAADAYRVMKSGRARGKLVVKVSDT